ncbi:hypothetical protein A2823_01660 [Candidatus Nomurabacteria bacterium RIFCSPHIGHO2_01_FULL_41_91]|nr:MAG: hypothetical protein A2823_01660 [Candidatus Nomurabacteria bacterium RIFCSPHIGHO2_01_FULL_41_91]OGI94300.1 MAG: hypothetical protein A3A07_03080 [Candidatus Nomurabacteria bacterium RIFCSPLOWO2_01_FULL_41_52]OGI97948.1 MAG: hypothetical protein A3H56_01400 [Candidatus Nomurabacteria bacterium RIFCSPLOWO2_02_FULL_42_24]OGJ03581.1 MAG: hypothetical protein A3F97_02235 [Candidatus Nomurabacteria bacterium RIFCSPLOWO2_12_FULL_41_10]
MNIFFLLVWLVLFIVRKDLRREILTMSVLIAPLGITQIFFFRDYWHPTYSLGTIFGVVGLEEIIFCFLIGGIAAVIYEEIFGLRYAKRHVKNHLYFMLGCSVLGILGMIIGNIVLGFNSMYVSIVLLLLISIAILIFRHDLLKDALFSGLLVGLFMFISYTLLFNTIFDGVIQKWWLLKNLSGILVSGVPIEELAWAFSWGLVAGPAYEFITGLKFKKIAN